MAGRAGFAPRGDRTTAARAGAALFGVGGVLGLAALAFPGGAGTSEAAAAATSLASLAVGLVVWFAGARQPPVFFQALGAGGTVLASVSAYYGGADGWLNAFYFFWVALFAAYFFTSVAVAAQLALIAVAFALALAGNDAIRDPGLVWFLTVTTVAVTAGVVTVLRRRLEQLLEEEHEQVERLRELDRLKDDLIATVSHELRTPVAAVYGAAETLIARPVPRPLRDELVRIVHEQALRLARLTDSLVTSEAIGRDLVEVAVEPVEVERAIESAAAAARILAPNRPITFAPDEGLTPALADRLRLEQALAAVFDNAIKYAPGGAIRIDAYVKGSSLRIAVSDDGPGIPRLERERVFDRFHRLDPHMRGGVGGSGLGLHIVRGLLRAMGGDAWIEESQADGRGTTVVLELRLASQPEQAPGAVAAAEA